MHSNKTLILILILCTAVHVHVSLLPASTQASRYRVAGTAVVLLYQVVLDLHVVPPQVLVSLVSRTS